MEFIQLDENHQEHGMKFTEMDDIFEYSFFPASPGLWPAPRRPSGLQRPVRSKAKRDLLPKKSRPGRGAGRPAWQQPVVALEAVDEPKPWGAELRFVAAQVGAALPPRPLRLGSLGLPKLIDSEPRS